MEPSTSLNSFEAKVFSQNEGAPTLFQDTQDVRTKQYHVEEYRLPFLVRRSTCFMSVVVEVFILLTLITDARSTSTAAPIAELPAATALLSRRQHAREVAIPASSPSLTDLLPRLWQGLAYHEGCHTGCLSSNRLRLSLPALDEALGLHKFLRSNLAGAYLYSYFTLLSPIVLLCEIIHTCYRPIQTEMHGCCRGKPEPVNVTPMHYARRYSSSRSGKLLFTNGT